MNCSAAECLLQHHTFYTKDCTGIMVCLKISLSLSPSPSLQRQLKDGVPHFTLLFIMVYYNFPILHGHELGHCNHTPFFRQTHQWIANLGCRQHGCGRRWSSCSVCLGDDRNKFHERCLGMDEPKNQKWEFDHHMIKPTKTSWVHLDFGACGCPSLRQTKLRFPLTGEMNPKNYKNQNCLTTVLFSGSSGFWESGILGCFDNMCRSRDKSSRQILWPSSTWPPDHLNPVIDLNWMRVKNTAPMTNGHKTVDKWFFILYLRNKDKHVPIAILCCYFWVNIF